MAEKKKSTKKDGSKKGIVSDIAEYYLRMNHDYNYPSEREIKDNASAYWKEELKKTKKAYDKYIKEGNIDYLETEDYSESGSAPIYPILPRGIPPLPPPINPPGSVSRPTVNPLVPAVVPVNPVAQSLMERDKQLQELKDKTLLEQTDDVSYEYLRSLEKKQNRVNKLKDDLFANSQIHQGLNADGVMVEKPLFIEQTNQARVNTSIGAFIRGNARRNKTGEWTTEDLMKHMIPIRS
jgi:hypothetical protein